VLVGESGLAKGCPVLRRTFEAIGLRSIDVGIHCSALPLSAGPRMAALGSEEGVDLPSYHLDDKQREALTALFRVLDLNSDGFLDLVEFARFGRALTGRDVEPDQASSQLARADADGDGVLSLEEWLQFGRFIARTPDFFALIDGIKAALARIDKVEGTSPVRLGRRGSPPPSVTGGGFGTSMALSPQPGSQWGGGGGASSIAGSASVARESIR
jgi:hypothetical protein